MVFAAVCIAFAMQPHSSPKSGISAIVARHRHLQASMGWLARHRQQLSVLRLIQTSLGSSEASRRHRRAPEDAGAQRRLTDGSKNSCLRASDVCRDFPVLGAVDAWIPASSGLGRASDERRGGRVEKQRQDVMDWMALSDVGRKLRKKRTQLQKRFAAAVRAPGNFLESASTLEAWLPPLLGWRAAAVITRSRLPRTAAHHAVSAPLWLCSFFAAAAASQAKAKQTNRRCPH
ncbi:uncharacterized protein PAN0_002c1372 [Moesziomyces antarcticus]|uniref:Uncharacterized protein n=1 Tax=Pseudozyma antarctica TaxID=84753 RepID=A0A5C3FG66_PSEA2|nr:uncharacterized protein PAN0_002c1372 [Moesziomyces antarcticus]GAK63169.1 hypothetical protein PAN0_002c1372 [Moesziomyces antarcticus]SPO43348.1 uncharacterized protein PSANT_01032 [Moesziomyces antarcticus]